MVDIDIAMDHNFEGETCSAFASRDDRVGARGGDTKMTKDYGKWLTRTTVEKLIPYAKASGVSKVALSPRGFIPQFRSHGRAGLDLYWYNRRNGFVARHLAQVGPSPYLKLGGVPTRRMLALAMWAYGDVRVIERFFSVTPAEYARLVRKGAR